AGFHVEGEEVIPHIFGEIAAGEPLHVDAVLERVLAFPPDGLALTRRECAEEVVEAVVARVFPVKLLVRSLQEANFAQITVFVLGCECDVHAGGAVNAAKLDKPTDQSLPGTARVRARPYQEPAAGRRREWYRDLQFRIIVAARMGISLSPALVEYIFAARVALEIARRRGDERTVGGLHQYMLNVPTGAGADRFRCFQSREKRVRQERVVGYLLNG